jgi:hypothetical protein
MGSRYPSVFFIKSPEGKNQENLSVAFTGEES